MKSRSGSTRSRRSAMRARRFPRLRLQRLPRAASRRLRQQFNEFPEDQLAAGSRPALYENQSPRAKVPAPHESEGASWRKKREQQARRNRRRHQKARAKVIVRDRAVHVRADLVVPAGAKAGGSISGARKSASSASRRLRTSTTRTFACSRSSLRRAERSFPGV